MAKIYKEDWTFALRSGMYKQTRGTLTNLSNDSFCALGVLCEIAGYFKEENKETRFKNWLELEKELNLDMMAKHMIIQMNDIKYCSFENIADFIDMLPLTSRPTEVERRNSEFVAETAEVCV